MTTKPLAVSERLVAEGMQFPWRWGCDTISLNLEVIWEMLDEECHQESSQQLLATV